MIAKRDFALVLRFGQKYSPPVIRHLHIAEARPPLRIDRSRRSQIDFALLESCRPHLRPPFLEAGLPLFERALEPTILRQVHIVRNPLGVIDRHRHTLRASNSARRPLPYSFSAPFSPVALGRWKIQFCHADSRAKILVSIVSGPAKRSDASIPVNASGEKAARSSLAIRTSSSQSISSGANVTSPNSSASSACRSSSIRPRNSSRWFGSSIKRVSSRASPFNIGKRRKFAPVSVIAAGGVSSPSRSPLSI